MKPFLLLQTVRPTPFHSGRTLGFIRSVFYLLALLLVASPAATVFADTHDELISKYISLKVSGQQEFDLSARPIDDKPIPPEQQKKLDAFKARMDNEAHHYYAARLTDRELGELIEWYGSTTGKKSVAALHKLYWPTLIDWFVCGMGHVSPDFFDRYKKLDACLHYSEEMTPLMMSSYNDMLSRKGVFSSDSLAEVMHQISPDELRAMKDSMLKTSQKAPRLYISYCFMQLSEAELQSCANFYGSALGRKQLEIDKVRRKKLQAEIFTFARENPEMFKSFKKTSDPPQPKQ
ncbi:MAG TPA: DUF2059 domain-containing protein [Chlorobaculum sp.]|nr:DUF2059 domain-containing protein [Chlorobaculum sp.]